MSVMCTTGRDALRYKERKKIPYEVKWLTTSQKPPLLKFKTSLYEENQSKMIISPAQGKGRKNPNLVALTTIPATMSNEGSTPIGGYY